MPFFVPLSLLPARALAFSFFTIASAFSLANETNLLHNPHSPSCYPASGSAPIPPLSEHDCMQALGDFQRNLPYFATPILTHDPDKAHLPQYILAPATVTFIECTFRADIPPGIDVPFDVNDLVYRARVLIAVCVGKADYEGGRSSVKAEGVETWINIDFRYSTPLATLTKVDVGNITSAPGLVFNSATPETLPSLSAIPGSTAIASR